MTGFFALAPIGVVRGGRTEIFEDHWGPVEARLILDPAVLDPDATAGLSELAQAIAVLARAQQDAVWDRIQAHNRLRSHLREYYPAFLAAFPARGGIMRPEARAVLAAAPTPADAARLTVAQLRGLLKKAGSSRAIDTEATRLRDAFRGPQMRQLPLVEHAMGRQALALPGQLDGGRGPETDRIR